MNSKNSYVEKINKYENEFSEFLVKRIGYAGGSLQLQHITGHFSQLRQEVRSSIGTSTSDLKNFLRKHNNLFCVNNNIVSLVDSSTFNNSGYDSDNSSIGPQPGLPSKINGKGVIVKIFQNFGYIKAKEPIKTDLQFNASSFGSKDIDLTSFLYIGSVVHFQAVKKSNYERQCKYYAYKVWKANESNSNDNAIIQKSRRNRETGVYDPLTLNNEGVIQNVFPNLGFIAVEGDEANTVFFYKNRVANYDNIVDLTKVLSKGDRVEFNAHRSTKPDAKARWEATKVWKKSGKGKQNVSKLNNSQFSSKSSLLSQSAIDVKNKAKELKKDQRGKICPRSHGAVIKFGDNELADGDSAVYYVCGSQVTDIGWEFSEGDDVIFDAVKMKSPPGWKAILVWVGNKPDVVLPTHSGDFNEFTDEEENGEISSSMYTSVSSSCKSESSSSSLKSVSVKSDSNSSKKKIMKEITSYKSDITDNKDIRDYKKVSKIHCLSSQDISQVSKTSDKLKKDANDGSSSDEFVSAVSKSISSWGDSPYPDDVTYENMLPSKCDISDSKFTDNNHSNVIKVSDEVQHTLEYASSIEDSTNEEINDDEFSNSGAKNNQDEVKCKLEEISSIKKFQDIKGKVTKVYSKFAEVKSCNLENTVSFFWNDFYYNGVSVEELELDDLKQVLKVGDDIYFNYFIIVDDSGQSWQRVTLAWNGSKPKRPIEISPEDFIKQNGLSVTINNELDIDEMQIDTVASRKFLTSFAEDVPVENCKISSTEYFSEDESSISILNSNVELHNETKLQTNFKNLSSTICQILKKNMFPVDSKVDLSSVSEEILKIAQESCNVIKPNDESCNSLSQSESSTEKIPDYICSNCKRNYMGSFSHQNINMKDCEVQTIITGEIIAQNIFTEC